MKPVGTAYFPHVDGLRALAVLAVMVYHLQPSALPGGFVGVDVFFVISGYVVTASLAAHRHQAGARFLGEFYARRLARLAPALVAMLVIVTALYVLLVPKAWFNRAAETTGQMAFFGLSNWWLDRQVVNYFEPRAEWNPFTHTWSLGVEEQFYLVVPLVLLFALRPVHDRRTRRTAILVVVVLAAASFIACHAFGLARGSRFVFYQLVFRFWELACGVLLYLWGARVSPLRPSLRRWYGWAGWAGLVLVLLAMVLPRPGAYP
ncbi:acyltransferase family protein [Azohydromonas sediminis]|uniref:acyltransferase family protein n=1 Tax=Azohydromonas sediminis TaxID=2259674 RepID=UPI000E65C298|nr:acyltransferase [Azohydromonas sediminis]